MEQPPGFKDLIFPHHVCRLKKALYGLKQAPKAWFHKFSSFLLHLGFSCSKADPSLFVLHSSKGTLLLLLYVDDIILTSNHSSLINILIQLISSKFAMKDMGDLHYFLGIKATLTKDGLFLSQHKYALDILQRTNVLAARPLNTPLSQKHALHDPTGALVDASEYRSIVGALQYLTLTRPEISHSVNLLCQFMQSPTEVHWSGVKRVLHYIAGTSQLGLRISAQSSLNLVGFSDADWAGCPLSRRSTSGLCVFLGSNCISWSSRKQNTVAKSSAEAEYRSLASLAAEVTWVTYILKDIGISLSQPPVLFTDNISALHLRPNPVLHARTKHVELDYHFVREKVVQGAMVTKFIPSMSQVADILTKPLSKFQFQSHRTKLGVVQIPHSSLRGC
ncbi:PREDICTED: uncharacterized protein LOC109226143 [Nicotiana attenuata]|uniref:uncharacterized protein LOC109226143 n=1 Tax=Nicotiana attenuata TaxID=49451 RepID=UPI000904AAD9|nr:PREDICTED: uncharacterized protein LOC109226143 [Nicotiana attenuata]